MAAKKSLFFVGGKGIGPTANRRCHSDTLHHLNKAPEIPIQVSLSIGCVLFQCGRGCGSLQGRAPHRGHAVPEQGSADRR